MNQEYKEHYNSKVLIFAGDGKAVYRIEGLLKSETNEKLFLTEAEIENDIENDIWGGSRKSNKLSVAKSKLVSILSV